MQRRNVGNLLGQPIILLKIVVEIAGCKNKNKSGDRREQVERCGEVMMEEYEQFGSFELKYEVHE